MAEGVRWMRSTAGGARADAVRRVAASLRQIALPLVVFLVSFQVFQILLMPLF